MSDERTTEQQTTGGPEPTPEPGRFGRMAASPGWRALAIGLGVVVILGILLGIPAYLATRPTYYARFAKMQPRVETWHTSVHAKVPCQGCHVEPGPLPQAAYAARMVGVFYKSLVMPSSAPATLAKPTNAACARCHMDLRSVSPAGDLNIPHRAHIEVLGLQCVRCHQFLVHEKSPEGSNHPRMVACLTCHDGKQAKNACSTCHTEKAPPKSHQATDWLVVHSKMQGKIDCARCHAWTQNWCADCHARRPRSHGPKWRSEHGAAVARHRNCETCHTAAFCIRCHGAVPKLNYDPTQKLVQ